MVFWSEPSGGNRQEAEKPSPQPWSARLIPMSAVAQMVANSRRADELQCRRSQPVSPCLGG